MDSSELIDECQHQSHIETRECLTSSNVFRLFLIKDILDIIVLVYRYGKTSSSKFILVKKMFKS